jgi:hypothetical protein
MFSLRSSIILLLVLFVPFLLRLLGSEPYPAVLLPSNAETILKSNFLTIENTRLFGIRNDRYWEEINKMVFFEPIPLEHAGILLMSHLCLNANTIRQDSKKDVLYRKLGLLRDRTLSAGDIHELHTWIKSRLSAEGFATAKIRIAVYRENVLIQTGAVIKKEILYEQVYTLD